MRILLTNLGMLFMALAAFVVVAIVHAGPECWIQGLNYLVAAVPFGLSSGHAWRWRLTQMPRARRMAIWYALIFLVIAIYSWHAVEKHRALIITEETALIPTLRAIEAYRETHGQYPASLAEIDTTFPTGLRFKVTYDRRNDDNFSLSFVHNIMRKHSYLSETRQWVDWTY